MLTLFNTGEFMKCIKPPLPFVGHKGKWGNILEQIALRLPKGCIVLDVFGGSGICSHYFKQARPDLTVIWNDFDDYRQRLDHAHETERLRLDLAEKLGTAGSKGSAIRPLSPAEQDILFTTFDMYQKEYGFVDYDTLSRWLFLYSHKTNKLIHAKPGSMKLYNRLPVVPVRVDACRNWLSGVERVRFQFHGMESCFDLGDASLKLCNHVADQDVFLIFDPPYLSTTCNDYRNRDALFILKDILDCCRQLPFILFGDSSISFWYEAILKGGEKYTMDFKNIGMNHKARSEVAFASLPMVK